MARWIKMPLSMEVGLDRSDTVRGGPSSPAQKRAEPQTAAWIKMPLGMEVGLGPGHIVLDGDPARPSPKRRHSPHPIFGPFLLWPNSCMDQDATWYGGRLRNRPHCTRWGPSSPKRGHSHRPSIFGPCLWWPNGWMDQDATWYEGRPRPQCAA